MITEKEAEIASLKSEIERVVSRPSTSSDLGRDATISTLKLQLANAKIKNESLSKEKECVQEFKDHLVESSKKDKDHIKSLIENGAKDKQHIQELMEMLNKKDGDNLIVNTKVEMKEEES